MVKRHASSHSFEKALSIMMKIMQKDTESVRERTQHHGENKVKNYMERYRIYKRKNLASWSERYMM